MSSPLPPIIVCGYGQVGYRVATLLLRADENFVVVTDRSRTEWMRPLQENGILVVYGDARDEQVLIEAGLMDARALIACTSNDLTNIEIALDAKRYRPDLPIVARLFDQNLATQLEGTLGVQQALAMSIVAAPAFAAAAFGDHVASEFSIDGKRFGVFRINVNKKDEFVGQNLKQFCESLGMVCLLARRVEGELVLNPPSEFLIQDGDILKLLGPAEAIHKLRPEVARGTKFWTETETLRKSISPLSFLRFFAELWRNASREIRAVLISINLLTLLSVFVFSFGMNLSFADALYFVITTVTTTGYGDISPKDASVWLKVYACLMMVLGSASVAVLYSIVTDYIVTARLQQLVGRQKVPEKDHVIVAGIGDVGYRIIEELERMGAKVVAVDLDGASKYFGTLRNRVPVLVGDARDRETLKRAGVEKAVAMIAATGDDAVNLSIGLASESLNPASRSVLRLFDGNFAQKVESLLNIDTAMSASRIAAPAFVCGAFYPGSVAAFVLQDHLFCVIKGDCPDPSDEWQSWPLVILANGKVEREGEGIAIRIAARGLRAIQTN